MEMRKAILILITGLLVAASAMSQPIVPTEKAAAEATINLYFDGWATGDTAKVGKAMHESCHLKFYREGKFTDMDRATYLGRFKQPPHERDKNLITRIVLLDITVNIASAKTEIITAKDIFTDYFNLIKTDDGWFIVDKVSVRTPK
jgi:aldose sugar dehydrogenase